VIPTLLELSTPQISALASAAERGALESPIEIALGAYCPPTLRKALGAELELAACQGLRGKALALFLSTLAQDRQRREADTPRVDLVWTGPDLPGDHSRDTRIVVHELFRKAQRSVLVSTFALYDGKGLFEPLHETWEKHPEMTVKLFMDVHRNEIGHSPEQTLARFRQDFRTFHWPWERVPEVYFDPRSLAPNPVDRACMHAKCVVVDDRDVFLTSANLTEAAQQRNIEAGVILVSESLAAKLQDQFEALVSNKVLTRLI
jgi:phosphatidylserine/phosphatidylglycerophosphate/cardiolipin synthase-like enzyme